MDEFGKAYDDAVRDGMIIVKHNDPVHRLVGFQCGQYRGGGNWGGAPRWHTVSITKFKEAQAEIAKEQEALREYYRAQGVSDEVPAEAPSV